MPLCQPLVFLRSATTFLAAHRCCSKIIVHYWHTVVIQHDIDCRCPSRDLHACQPQCPQHQLSRPRPLSGGQTRQRLAKARHAMPAVEKGLASEEKVRSGAFRFQTFFPPGHWSLFLRLSNERCSRHQDLLKKCDLFRKLCSESLASHFRQKSWKRCRPSAVALASHVTASA